MKHTILLNDVECLVVLDSLRMLIENTEKHEVDKNLAKQITENIKNCVVKDKRNA